MNHLSFLAAWEAPPTPPLSPSDVLKPLPVATAAARPCGRSPAAAMRELAALATNETESLKVAVAASVGQSLLLSAAQLLALECAHTALSAEFDDKMNRWESAIYISSPSEVAAARAAALETLEPLREAVAAVDAARFTWAALDILRGVPAAQIHEFTAEFGQEEADQAGIGGGGGGGAPAPAAQAPSPIESLIKYLGDLTSSAVQKSPDPLPQQLESLSFHPAPAPFQHMPPASMLGGPQPAPVLVRSRPAASPPIFGGVPLTEPRSSPPRRGPSPTLHNLGGDDLGMLTPIAEGGPSLVTEGVDLSTVLAVAATGAPAWTAGPAHSGLEAADDPMFGLSHMLKQQLDAMFAQQHSGGGESAGVAADDGGGDGSKSRGAEGEELEYADVLCAMGRDREDGGVRAVRRNSSSSSSAEGGEDGPTPTPVSEILTPGTSPEDDLSDPKAQTHSGRLVAAVAPFFSGPGAAAPPPLARVHGVTRHKRTSRYEAHVWTGKSQSYLGSYDIQAAAARAHDIGALRAGVSEARLNYPASDYAAIKPLLEPMDMKSVAGVLKEIGRKQVASGRGSAAAGRGGGAVGRKRGRPGGSPGTQAENLGPIKRKGPSERSPLA